MRKRLLLALLVIALVGGGAAYFMGWLDPLFGRNTTTSETPGAAVSAAPDVEEAAPELTGSIIADARVVPVQSADLSMSAGGIVSEILLEEGAEVAAGDLILRLDAALQQAAVSRAQADLQQAQARLAELEAGPRPQEITAAQASLAAAQAALLRIEQGQGPGEIAAANAAVDGARASVQKVLEGASDQELITAQANMANAEAELQRAQRAYNDVKWRNDVGALPQAAALQTATNNVEAARARYADLTAGPTNATVGMAQAELRRAQAQLSTLEETLPTNIAAAQAQVQAAQAQVDLLEAGSRPESIASAQAVVAAATAGLQQALINLADTELRAPFSGTIAELNVEVGEQLTPGTPVSRLAKLGEWEIRTEDLTEFQVVGIKPGDQVALTFDAIPDLAITGTVDRIRQVGADRRGDIVYTVVVTPDQSDSRILWNMTAVTEFDAE